MLTSRYDDAFRYAHDLHRGQTRKGTSIPYISHLMIVSAIVIEHGGNEDQAIAALLHDAAEDQGGQATLDEIRSEASATRLARLFMIVPTHGLSRNRNGDRVRKLTLRRCRKVTALFARFTCRQDAQRRGDPVRLRFLAIRCGKGLTAARMARAGIMALWPRSSGQRCRDCFQIVSKGR